MAPLIPMSPSDYTWLQMDRPTNLMHVRCIMWYAGDLDIEVVRQWHLERMVNRYDVFKQRAVNEDGRWYWQDVDDFDINRHIYEVPAPGDGGRQAALDYMADTTPHQFDFDHPLWFLEVMRGVTGLEDEPVTVIWQRFHHAMLDGIRLVQLLVHLHDFEDDPSTALPGAVGRKSAQQGKLARGLRTLRRSANDATDIAENVMRGATHLPFTFVQHLRHGNLGTDLSIFVHPSRIINTFQRIGSVDNKWVNTTGEVARLLAIPHETRRAGWPTTPVPDRRIDYADGMDLGLIREFAKRHGATFNDVMLGILSKSLTRYLQDLGTPIDEVHWMLPVAMTPIDPELPTSLGNDFALILLAMPLEIDDWDELLPEVQERMARLKNSQEPTIAHELQRMMARAPRRLSVGMTNHFANKTIGVFTNVPGPTRPMFMAGVEALSWIGYVPTSGDEPMGVCICSYNNKVLVGLITDAHAIPDPERILALVKHNYQEVVNSLKS